MSEFDWRYDAARRLYHVRYTGVLRIDVFNRVREIRRGFAEPLGRVRMLIDAREADLSELTADDFKRLETARAQLMEQAADRAAGLIGSDIDLGIAELWAHFRHRSVPGSTRIFTIESEALAWLLADDEPE
jgi:hypothetical protein